MRKLLVFGLIGLLAACGGGNPGPAPTSAPSSAVQPSGSASQDLNDIYVRDVSVARPLDLTRRLIGANYTVRVVPSGAQLDCTLIGDSQVMTVDGDKSQTPFYCTQGYVAVPASIQKLWKTWPATVIWYFAAKSGVFSQPVYNHNNDMASCAAAYVTTKRIGYTLDDDGKKLIDFVRRLHGDTEAAFINAGLTAAASGEPISACQG